MKTRTTSTGLVLSVLLAACGSEPRTVQVPPRPANLPAPAEWRGGPDGGNWVSCETRDDVYICSNFWVDGELYSRQAFRLCAEAEPTRLFGGHNLSGVVAVDTLSGSVRFVPTGPAEIFTDGSLDQALTAKARMDFEAEASGDCPVALLAGPDGAGAGG